MSSVVFAFGRSLAFMSTKDFKHPVPPFECMRRSMECHVLASVEKLSRQYNVPVDHRAVKSLVNLFTECCLSDPSKRPTMGVVVKRLRFIAECGRAL